MEVGREPYRAIPRRTAHPTPARVVAVAIGFVVALYGGGVLIGAAGAGDIAAAAALGLLLWASPAGRSSGHPPIAVVGAWLGRAPRGRDPLVVVLVILDCIVVGVFSRPVTG